MAIDSNNEPLIRVRRVEGGNHVADFGKLDAKGKFVIESTSTPGSFVFTQAQVSLHLAQELKK
jgi:hypothetical protein